MDDKLHNQQDCNEFTMGSSHDRTPQKRGLWLGKMILLLNYKSRENAVEFNPKATEFSRFEQLCKAHGLVWKKEGDRYHAGSVSANIEIILTNENNNN
jgi:hypothetical protein